MVAEVVVEEVVVVLHQSVPQTAVAAALLVLVSLFKTSSLTVEHSLTSSTPMLTTIIASLEEMYG